MSGLTGALCRGKGDLFTATNAIDHYEAALICADCPAIEACRELAQGLLAGPLDKRPIGTYAGELYGGRGRPPGRPREHGTEKGYQQHRNRKEPACPPCRHAVRKALDARLKYSPVGGQLTARSHQKWDNKGEPDRGVSAPQPGSDRLPLLARGEG